MSLSKKNLIILLFSLAGLNVLTFFYAIYIDYHIYDWFDIVLHLWGGFTVGLAYCIYFKNSLSEIKNRFVLFLSIVGVAMFVGVGWEWFEWLHDHLWGIRHSLLSTQANVTDTMKDLFDDLLGGIFIALLFLRQRKLKK